MSEALPLLYLDGLSTSDFGPALEQFLASGSELSATTITRLTLQWLDEATAFAARDLSGTDCVSLAEPRWRAQVSQRDVLSSVKNRGQACPSRFLI